ncbi:hypothetical protein [Listeria monocytogenes]|uniref:Uncharacterized protein n=1 Tax=Listeria monocytogenes TaxID=1639 RepID=A0A6C8MYH7_LISMN|nr:hypothetical protein [Listeria monocytogenes]KAA9534091.1 hypothetical protein DCK33_08090 [Listeria monocytogenes]KAA9541484.1 hypothetical protein DCK32_10375 [Listeria monocytogenes]HAB7745299.1 hypothetical protein [Listeria monocytogenes]
MTKVRKERIMKILEWLQLVHRDEKGTPVIRVTDLLSILFFFIFVICLVLGSMFYFVMTVR